MKSTRRMYDSARGDSLESVSFFINGNKFVFNESNNVHGCYHNQHAYYYAHYTFYTNINI